jgi:hypothetical protein
VTSPFDKRLAAVSAGVGFLLLIAGCDAFPTRPSAASVCAAQALTYRGVVVGSFDTVLGRVRMLGPLPAEPDRWPGKPDSYPAALCYIDGEIPHAPPQADPFDRVLVSVVDNQPLVIAAGYRRNLPIRAR